MLDKRRVLSLESGSVLSACNCALMLHMRQHAMPQARKCPTMCVRSCAQIRHARHVLPRARRSTMSVQSCVDASRAQHLERGGVGRKARARAVMLDMHRVLRREGGSMLSPRNCALMLRMRSARCFKCFLALRTSCAFLRASPSRVRRAMCLQCLRVACVVVPGGLAASAPIPSCHGLLPSQEGSG